MAMLVMLKVQAQRLGSATFLRLLNLLKAYIDNPTSGKNAMMLNSQMNEGNSPPLKVQANLKYSKK